MIARFNYFSPLGIIKIQADAIGITEVKFVDQSEREILILIIRQLKMPLDG